MSSDNRFIIEKQFVDINVKSTGDAFDIRTELENVCKNELMPEIEKLFDSIIPEDKLIRIENLEIDVGIIPADGWKKEFINSVLNELTDKVETLSDNETETSGHLSSIIDKKENDLDTLLYFLERGYLPWHSDIKNRTGINILLKNVLNSGDDVIYRFRYKLSNNRDALNRFTLQFDQTELDKFSNILLSGNDKSNALKILSSALDSLNLKNEHRKGILYLNWFEVLLNTDRNASGKMLLKDTASGIFNSLKSENDIRLSNLFKNKLSGQIKQFDEFEGILKNIDADNQVSNLTSDEIKKTQKGKKILSESQWYINNCGIVIIHPFLVRLFENTGYTENNEWVSIEHQQRAIALTQFAVTGAEVYPEFLLMLNKVLCGYDILESLPSDIILSEFEKNEANEMLESVIGHWGILKNTSIAGLRETFLKRNGKLSKEENEWRLQVEEKTVDILLNKLPWGMSVIKLPWMEAMLKTEWIY